MADYRLREDDANAIGRRIRELKDMPYRTLEQDAELDELIDDLEIARFSWEDEVDNADR